MSPDTRVLVPGCGKGHDAAAWAEAGFETTGMDLSDLALNEARAKYEALSNLAFTHGNFLEDKPHEPYDLVFEHTMYCAINPERRTNMPNPFSTGWPRTDSFSRFILFFPSPTKARRLEQAEMKS